MGQAGNSAIEHFLPETIEWELFHDPHGRPTTPVRMLKTDGPSFLETKFEPNFSIGHHWHPFDTLYIIMDGNMTIGPEGNFVPGDIRWIKAGHVYGPEVSGDKGVRFFLMSMGDEIGLNWADLYETPQNLSERLETLPDRWGRVNFNEVEAEALIEGATLQTLSDSNPYIQRIKLQREAILAAHKFDRDTLCMVYSGEIAVKNEGELNSEQFRWIPAGTATEEITAGPEGAELIAIGVDGLPNLKWL
tara:strand:- start:274 stop:1014 length:741 start_codon:yes stop_codon:yes gene_type:complete